MLTASLSLTAERSQSYFNSLCRHFAHKVEVTRTDNRSASVAFPMGTCVMQVQGQQMLFDAAAEDQQALEKIQYIIDSHVIRFRELKDAKINWRSHH